jgi:hypothetical protein
VLRPYGYGNWSSNTATTILPQLMTNLNGSAYFNTNGSYFDNSRQSRRLEAVVIRILS